MLDWTEITERIQLFSFRPKDVSLLQKDCKNKKDKQTHLAPVTLDKCLVYMVQDESTLNVYVKKYKEVFL